MWILGVSHGDRDSAAVLVGDGTIVAAAEEERFTRRKHQGGFPHHAVAYCLAEAGIGPADLEVVAVPGPGPGPDGLHELVERPLAHAASGYHPSPFDEAAVLVLDGAFTATAIGRGGRLRLTRHHGQGLGTVYSAVTRFLGFKPRSGEYKVMGLAAYGEPRHRDALLDRLVNLRSDGWFSLASFDQATLAALFGLSARGPDATITQAHMDVAASLQAVTEEAILRLAQGLGVAHGVPNLCLAGGVALNCVANGKILRDGAFENLWVQPASGEAGGALGAALAAGSSRGCPRPAGDAMRGGYLGPSYTQADIERRLTAVGARFTALEGAAVIDATARALAEGKAVGWFQGRMEFGPRALGGRSILGDPRSPTMQRTLNLKIKFRESFRPFAPSVLREDVSNWFEIGAESPYMLMVAPVVESHRIAMTEEQERLFGIDKLNVRRSDIPAVTHVDYSARIQTVDAGTNPRYHALIGRFKELTGCPMVVNTSFNVRGEPIVCTPEDAFRCFMGTGMEVLVAGDCFLRKEEQDPGLMLDYRNRFGRD